MDTKQFATNLADTIDAGLGFLEALPGPVEAIDVDGHGFRVTTDEGEKFLIHVMEAVD